MAYEIELRRVEATPIAAVNTEARLGAVGGPLIAALDKVYALLRGRGVTGLGHNVAIYRGGPGGLIALQAGVQTPEPIAPEGEVIAASTPDGRAATTTHWGPYEALGVAHRAVADWLAANQLRWTLNWEVYGDWSDDPAGRRTDVFYLIDEEVAS